MRVFGAAFIFLFVYTPFIAVAVGVVAAEGWSRALPATCFVGGFGAVIFSMVWAMVNDSDELPPGG